MLKRSRLEVYFDVLKAIGEGVDKPTRIMYKANLSWNTLEDALSTLCSREFVVEKRVGSSRRYVLSSKGQNALEHFNKALENLTTSQNLIIIRH
jgi:predicted transcriptional regulator